ncbi:MAG: TauD/TfdA dioxygenase family protein [Lautropia sp.]
MFRKIGKTFVARAVGIDLAKPLTRAEIDAIEAALAQYGVVVFPGQPLSAEQQYDFIKSFGPPTVATLKEIAGNSENFFDVGTVDDDGKVIPPGSVRAEYLLANRLWHTDGSFNQPPIRLTALLARVLPPVPPPTEYADMRAAWEALAPERQAEIEHLTVEHNVLRSREQIGMTVEKFSSDTLQTRKPVVHPLVRTHPLNGRKSLYLASHASHVVGWPLEQGRALIEELIAFATQPRFVYSHPWQVHDLLLWDDRWTMHRATPYDEPHPRMMRQCSVREEAPV